MRRSRFHLSACLLAALGLLFLVSSPPAQSAPSGEGSPNCVQTFRDCRSGCITEDTRFFLGLVIDGDTNACFLDCDLDLLECVFIQLEGPRCGC